MSYLYFIFINIFNFIQSLDLSLLKINYFNQSKYLYYTNAINNNEDLYIEYWGEKNKMRYFFGINGTTEEEIYFGNNNYYQIEASSTSIYHDSIVINNNKKNNIFSFNFNYLDFINLEETIFTSKKTKELIAENVCDSSYRNSIIKLKNNNYLLSIVICVKFPFVPQHHEIFFRIFNFKSNKIDGYNNVISNFPKTVGYSNATSCFQTEKGYIECSFCSVFPINGFTIGIYDLNFKLLGPSDSYFFLFLIECFVLF